MLLSVVVGALQSADGPFSSLLPSAAKEGLTAQPPEQPAADRDEQVAARVAAIHRIDVLAPAAAKITNTSAPNATHRGGGAKGAKVDARVAERLRMRQRARARGRASALAESKDALCDNFVAKFAPPAANTCAELEQRDRPLIIVAGDGRTPLVTQQSLEARDFCIAIPSCRPPPYVHFPLTIHARSRGTLF